MIIGGHFRDFASIHHFHPKAASFGFLFEPMQVDFGIFKMPSLHHCGSFIVSRSTRCFPTEAPAKDCSRSAKHRAVPDSDFARSLVQAEAADNIDGFTQWYSLRFATPVTG
ncbi:MAG: hypothetical protein K0Q83_920 [Deltaproteobacteria bacterium]|jgi:hypothetical protein|nr:hypothetical protein [Deltaproteobacteria bacterium]